MSENKSTKNPAVSYSILLALLLAVFAILVAFAYLDRSSWNEGLKNQVVAELQDDYSVGEMVEISGAVSTSVYACNVTEKATGKNLIAVIAKVTTIYGPIPGIFVYDLNSSSCQFVKYLTLGGIAARQITENTTNSQIQYWKNHIPSVIMNCTELGGALGAGEDN